MTGPDAAQPGPGAAQARAVNLPDPEPIAANAERAVYWQIRGSCTLSTGIATFNRHNEFRNGTGER